MTRAEALAGMDAAIAKATGRDLEILTAHRVRMVAGWKDADDRRSRTILCREVVADFTRGIDFRVR